MKKIIALTLLCAVAALGVSQTVAADAPATPPAPAKKANPAKGRAVPYKGEVAAIDQQAKTVTVGERVFQITSETRIRKQDKPATLADVKVGDQVTGQYRDVNGKLEAASVYVREAKAGGDKKK
ncbi:MAG: hypothetical protein HZA90_21075 [Verrucomicrobia bacterium]|nr:hypothetical protein [Verrucomicrobiota bacterium]